ncbi:tetratricopeptide repeat protein [Pseudidiomarina sp. GXY010]|uniref:Tetratricopeptide repeat protein n=1 Tax=Pseudidiomarina fusca TaxID=2965078 RepID=A0ABU3KXL0_9GAMM|nr:tetratricopeptide repeat protein [Pseudidiomarina sp. GXY010]MDT7525876.1 tetratricopeptide repeat protein [Pseudidiomarina sp. GXY010]
MSVINRMLRDLDKREQQQNNQAYTPAAVAPSHGSKRRVALIASIGAILVLAVLVWQWWHEGLADPALDPAPDPVAQQAESPNTDPGSYVMQALQAEPAQPEPAVAQEATPEAANAVSETSDDATEGRNQLVVNVAELQQPAVAQPEPAAIIAAASQAEPQEELADPAPDPAPKVGPTPTSTSSMKVERVELTPAQLAETNLRRAREAMAKGDRDLAQELLEKALIVQPMHVEVRSELAAYWYGRGFATRALTILQQGLDRQPQQSEWQLLYARILDRMGRVDQAYSALININEETDEALELLELRAAAANQLGYYAEAAADYTVLAGHFLQSRWWLAAAVAHEDSDNPAAAVRAYQQALQYRDLSNEARQYINDRLYALTPIEPETN